MLDQDMEWLFNNLSACVKNSQTNRTCEPKFFFGL